MLRLILFMICNFCAICSTIQYVKIFKFEKNTDKIICGTILYFFRIIIVELVLGYLLKYLKFYSITMFFILEFMIIYIVTKIKKDSILLYIYNLILQLKNKKIEIKFNYDFIVNIIFFVVFIIVSCISLTIYEYSFDGNYYHLPHIIDYIQQGKIFQTNNSLWNNVYPKNIELLNMFYMIFTRSINLARIPQIIFSILGMIGVYSLLKELSFDTKISYRCSILYFVAPFVLTQIPTTYIDLVGCSIFILLLYLLLEILKTNETKYEVVFFILLSIFLGTKGTYIIYAIVMSLIYIIFKINKLIKKDEKITSLIIKETIFFCIILFVGCSWMIQNLLLFNNPIHPFKCLWIDGLEANIDIGEENEPFCIKGKSDIEKIAISWIGLNSSYLNFDNGMKISNLFKDYDYRIGSLGIEWTFLLIPSIIISFLLIVFRKYKINKYHAISIIVPIICFICTPANWWGRYVGYIVVVGYIAYAIIYSIFKNNKIYKYINNVIFFAVFLFSIMFSIKNMYNTVMYTTPYSLCFSNDFRTYIESENKNIIVLEESYYEIAKAFVFLRGSHMQNVVNTYYIKDMYPNPKVKNHGIENYENFKNIVEETKYLDAIIILDASHNRENYKFLEMFYNENMNNYIKRNYGDDIIVYEKVK